MQTPATSVMTDEQKFQLMGTWSMIGLLILMLAITLITGFNYGSLGENLFQFFTGHLELVINGSQETLLSTALTVIAITLINVVLALTLGSLLHGKVKSFDSDALNRLLDTGPILVSLTILLEETFRWLFLGLLTNWLTGSLWFWILFFISNSLWAWVHLKNIKNPEERKFYVVIPQFVGGIFWSYLLVRYGFLAALMAHYLYDCVIFASLKEKKPTFNLINIVYFILIGALAWGIAALRGINMAPFLEWMKGSIGPAAGYQVYDYFLILIGVECMMGVLNNILLLDPPDAKESSYTQFLNGISGLLALAIGSVIAIFLFYMIPNWVFGWFIPSVVGRAFAITLLLSFTLARTSSGSALTRATIMELPSTFLVVVAFGILGFWWTVLLLMIMFIVKFIPSFLDSN